MSLNIHESVKEKLEYFKSIHKIPNIIFHGSSGSGKRTIVNDFIHSIYNNDRDKIKSLVMYVNCAHGKGIKFIRDELKFFAKTHINSNGGDIFKSLNQTFKMKDVKITRLEWLKKELLKTVNKKINIEDLMDFSTKLYEKGYSGTDIINLIEVPKFMEVVISNEKRYELLIAFNKVRKEFRNEKLIILFILNFVFLNSEISLENISFI